MTTLKKTFLDRLESLDLSPEDAGDILTMGVPKIEATCEEGFGMWDKDANSFNRDIFEMLWKKIVEAAMEWIRKHPSRAHFRPNFK